MKHIQNALQIKTIISIISLVGIKVMADGRIFFIPLLFIYLIIVHTVH